MFLQSLQNPHQDGRMTRAMVFPVGPGTRFAIDAETLHRQPKLLNRLEYGLEARIRWLDRLAYALFFAAVLAAIPLGWWLAGVGLLVSALLLRANRKVAARIAREAARRSTDHFCKLHEMGCLWLVRD
jgi:hypothetical protein